MKLLRKLDNGEEVLGTELDVEIYSTKSFDGKELGEYEIEMIGTTPAIDSYGESIDPTGWDLKRFKKNPVILPQHNYSKPPVGRATSIKLVDDKLMFKIEFPEEGVNPEADVYRKLYKSGFMNASSVGFVAREWVDGDGKKKPVRTYQKQELLELSLVSIPANPEALVTARSILSDDEIKLIHEVNEEIKGMDPYEAIGMDMQSQINSINEKLDEMEDMHEEFISRIIYLEGVVAGLGMKSMESKGYMKEILRDAVAKSTDCDSIKSELMESLKKGGQ